MLTKGAMLWHNGGHVFPVSLISSASEVDHIRLFCGMDIKQFFSGRHFVRRTPIGPIREESEEAPPAATAASSTSDNGGGGGGGIGDTR